MTKTQTERRKFCVHTPPRCVTHRQTDACAFDPGDVSTNDESEHPVEDKPESYFDRKIVSPSINVNDAGNSLSASATTTTKKGFDIFLPATLESSIS
jgi:hypothetical protein